MQYKVFRLSEIEGQGIIEGGHPGLLPFAPLMKRPAGMASEEWLRECIRKAAPISPYISERIETSTRTRRHRAGKISPYIREGSGLKHTVRRRALEVLAISPYIREGSGLKPPNVRVQDLRRAFLSLHFHENKD